MHPPPFEIDVESIKEPVVRVTGRFDWNVEAWSWEDLPADATTTDATMRLDVASVDFEQARFSAYVHLRLERPAGRGPWVVPVTVRDAQLVTEGLAHDGWQPRLGPPFDQDVGETLWDGEYLLEKTPPYTRAPRWERAAADKVTRDLRLPPDALEWDQDWPLSVANADQLEEITAYYDRADDDAVRFDTMSLALYAFDEQQQRGGSAALERWFDDRVRRDFRLHGHLIRYWSCLGVPDASLEEYGFAIAPQMRRLYFESLRPLAIALP